MGWRGGGEGEREEGCCEVKVRALSSREAHRDLAREAMCSRVGERAGGCSESSRLKEFPSRTSLELLARLVIWMSRLVMLNSGWLSRSWRILSLW